jgi:hypothetical protein
MTLANFASQLLGAIASLIGLPGLGQYFLVQVTESIAQPIAFVLACAKVAPASRYRVALVLAFLYAFHGARFDVIGEGRVTVMREHAVVLHAGERFDLSTNALVGAYRGPAPVT